MSSTEPEVSWKAIERDAAVVARDGEEVGKAKEIAGDPDADIFSGLVVSVGMGSPDRFLAAERVTGIWRGRVEVDLSRGEIEALPEYTEPVSERWEPKRPGLLSRLFGRR
ncbi:MAG TPA: PRC-barrel domain-containing protein [Gaiellaceae bacterium]|nr:PRC-barrel domain-containing protein [Gaiellaceae bacterium]